MNVLKNQIKEILTVHVNTLRKVNLLSFYIRRSLGKYPLEIQIPMQASTKHTKSIASMLC